MLNCKLMILAINTLNNNFILHTKIQNYHLKYPTLNVIMYTYILT